MAGGTAGQGAAADSLPVLAVLLGLIAESSEALDSADDAVRVAAATELRTRMIEVDLLVDDSVIWDRIFGCFD
ncbi:hypothetical protein [Streptomyces sp. NBC_00299]|uniref:hypothetical protein n=1 Tax=Streptomyces sp. NBC_00299 TaxID=2975705 RepID=UPI002E2DF7B9|nr:hypothetical protein [Streptomyces sp. NBC_00299]